MTPPNNPKIYHDAPHAILKEWCDLVAFQSFKIQTQFKLLQSAIKD